MIHIDSDTHFTPLDAFADLDPKYSEQGPRVVALPTGRYRIDYPARVPHVPAHIKPLRVNGRPRSDFEIEPRLEAMAQDGFDMQVLIPNNSPFYYDVDAIMGANVSRAYNKSISRVLKRYPNKFVGIAAAPLQDIKLAIGEAEHAIKELGLHSVSFTRTSMVKTWIARFSGRFTRRWKEWERRSRSMASIAGRYSVSSGSPGTISTCAWVFRSKSLRRFQR